MNDYIEIINKKLNEYMVIEYPEDIFKSMKYTVTLPGKRLRPVMCLEACRIFGGETDLAVPTACAIEMLHAQSLIHDDLPCMDNDDFRRGKPSNHRVFTEAIAVLAGDALLSYAPQVIIENSKTLPDKTLIRVLHEFMTTAGAFKLIAGQVADIESEKGIIKNTKEETLKFIHTHKTADLFKLALKSGAIIAGADGNQIDKMEEFGQIFGLAFQIYDDIMDEVSTFEELGKTVGKDKKAGKLTYVSLYGLENARDKIIELTAQAHEIIDRYNSEIFVSLLDKITSKITVKN
ncbi:MAG: polyprenyl synthetase family protein [Candidatus Gastranaerophilales bacterium]|nr:polyprenyl synthetase family protein [Candidatus Gastranaerophilales bacterium]